MVRQRYPESRDLRELDEGRGSCPQEAKPPEWSISHEYKS